MADAPPMKVQRRRDPAAEVGGVSRVSSDAARGLDLTEGEDLGDVPCDTVAALQLASDQFLRQSPEARWALVLRSQIHSIIDSRTNSDREIDDLRRRNLLRMFKLPAGSEDYALMLSTDYEQCLRATARPCPSVSRILACLVPAAPYTQGHLQHCPCPPVLNRAQSLLQEGGTTAAPDAEAGRVIERFCQRVLSRCSEMSISHNKLIEFLARPCDNSSPKRMSGVEAKLLESDVSALLKSGCIRRQHRPEGSSSESYWFAIPGAGPVLKEAVGGRQEIMALMRRRRYPEILQNELEKKKLRASALGMRFHIQDLVGLGHLKKIATSAGTLLRISDTAPKA